MFYPYWEEVHKLIKLYLEIEGIHIVQIIQGDYPVIQGADLTLGTLTNQQLAYVVKIYRRSLFEWFSFSYG